MPLESMIVEFVGPLSWLGGTGIPSIFEAEIGKRSGLYLWTVPLDAGELVYYVGETGRSFAQRMLEHLDARGPCGRRPHCHHPAGLHRPPGGV